MSRQVGRRKLQRRPPPGSGPLQRAVRRLALPVVIVLVAAGIIGGLVFAVSQTGEERSMPGEGAEIDDSPDLPGQFFASQGGAHLNTGTVYPVCGEQITEDCYASNPPASGPMDSATVQRGIYDEPQPREQLVHNMEHAGVIVWYNCAECEEEISALRKIVEDYGRDGRLLVMTPYSEMEADTIALTGWTRLDKFRVDEFDERRVRRFIETHECRFDPEGIC